ncbi:MAG TPA: PAS domain S-box protein, partial [Tepidiformaceae bacterium]|nr:PAS domain S-box protein [Tepidiformaceae bacterium]
MSDQGDRLPPGDGPRDESDEGFRLLFFRNPLPMWVIERGTARFLEVNDMAVRTYGYSREEFLSLTAIELCSPDERERYREFLATGGQDREGDVGTWRHQKKDGRRISVQVHGHTLTFNGRPARLIIAEDVTERLAAQSAAAQLSDIVESSSDAIISRDRDGNIVSWNPAAERLFGYTEAEALGKGPELLNPPEGAPDYESGLRRALAGESFVIGSTVRMAKDGRRLELNVSVFPIYGESEVEAVGIIARDATAERKAELAIAQLAAIVESSNDAIVARDLDGVVISWNPAAERIYGYTAEEAIGQGIEFLTVASRVEEMKRRMAEIAAGGAAASYEVVRPTKDGREIVVALSAFPVRSESGEVIAVATISRDVSAERQSQREMARLGALVASSEDAIMSVDLDRNYVTWNDGAERMFGYTADEAVGHSADRIHVHPGELIAEREIIAKTLAAGRATEVFETQRLRKDGTRFDVSTSYFPIRDPGGKVIGYANVSRDITARKAAERVLARLAAIVDATDDAVTTVDLEGRYTSWNPGAERLFGYSEAEVLGLNAGLLYPPDWDVEAERAIVWGALNKGASVSDIQTVRRRKDGSLVDVAVSYFPIADRGGNVLGFANISRDISARKAAERELRESHERYELATRATNDAIWDWDLHTDALLWSPQFAAIFGYRDDEIAHTIDFREQLIHPAERERVVASIDQAIAGGSEYWGAEYPLLRGDGTYARVADRGVIQRDESGSATRVIGAIVDITERFLAIEALEESEARFRAVTEAVPAGLLAWDSESVFFVNEAMSTILGYPREKLLEPGFVMTIIFADDRPLVRAHIEALTKGDPAAPSVFEFRYVHGDGDVRWLRFTATPVTIAAHQGILAAAFDV